MALKHVWFSSPLLLSITRYLNPRLSYLQPVPLQPLLMSLPGPPTLQKQYMSSTPSFKPKKAPEEPRPSASILLVSSENHILLLHRVKTSSTFASAHVFPGGNLSTSQDGAIPSALDPHRHVDGLAYRIAAIRECFEESGILLARGREAGAPLLHVPEAERNRARKEIHAGRLRFVDWVAAQGGVLDTEALIPYTRWITPTNVPRRFTTQMYIYWLPLLEANTSGSNNSKLRLSSNSDVVIQSPTSDGGLEHTAAVFASCEEWLRQARAGEIILFPPQFFLMYHLAPYLHAGRGQSVAELRRQREGVTSFLKRDSDGNGVAWADKVISPMGLFMRKSDGRSVLSLENPGLELEGSDRKGCSKWVVLVRFSKEGPREVEVRDRKEVVEEEAVEKAKIETETGAQKGRL